LLWLLNRFKARFELGTDAARREEEEEEEEDGAGDGCTEAEFGRSNRTGGVGAKQGVASSSASPSLPFYVAPRQCGCGQVGCVEAHASGPAITSIANDFVLRSRRLRCRRRGMQAETAVAATSNKREGPKKSLPADDDDSGQGSVGGVLSPPLLFPNCAAVFASASNYKGDHRQMGSSGNYVPPPAAAAAGVMTDDDDKDEGMEGHGGGYGHGSDGQEAACDDDDALAVGQCAHAAVHHAALNLARLCLAFARTHDPRAFVVGNDSPRRDDGDNTNDNTDGDADGRDDRGNNSGGGCSWFLLLIERKYRALDWTAGDSALPEFLSASSPNAALVGAAVLASTDTAL